MNDDQISDEELTEWREEANYIPPFRSTNSPDDERIIRLITALTQARAERDGYRAALENIAVLSSMENTYQEAVLIARAALKEPR